MINTENNHDWHWKQSWLALREITISTENSWLALRVIMIGTDNTRTNIRTKSDYMVFIASRGRVKLNIILSLIIPTCIHSKIWPFQRGDQLYTSKSDVQSDA